MKSNDIPSALHVDHGLWESMLYTILLYSGLISNMHSASAKRESYSSTDQPLAQWRQGRQVLWQVPSGMLSLLKEKLSKIESKRDIAARQRDRERGRERERECGKTPLICCWPVQFCLLLLTCLDYGLHASAKPHPCKAVKQFWLQGTVQLVASSTWVLYQPGQTTRRSIEILLAIEVCLSVYVLSVL